MLKVLAGDWKSGSYAKLNTSWGKLNGLTMPVGLWRTEKVSATEIVSTELVTEENRHSLVKKLGWTLAGDFLLGPLGGVLGFWKGGERKDRVVVVLFKDGRKAVLCGELKYASKLLGLSSVRKASLAKATAAAPRTEADPRSVDTSRWSKADRETWNSRHGIEPALNS